ncbi:MAG TPA: TetR/AcrR family transcriptional regulator [Ktedonobacteraceae bacterium]|nr:TetR/AcrR family transcriptional regulator [Ktedonobacteraceae bacterium]
MDIESSALPNARRQELKVKYLTRLLPVIKQQGLSHLKIDDMVRFMGISKATFYKYFSSKEDVLEQGVGLVVGYFQQATTLIGDDSSSHLLRFQNAFAQSLFIASYFPDTFLLELKQTFPLLWERIKQAQQERQQQLQQFYEQGIALGIFHPIKPVLAVLQNDLFLRNIMDPIFLMEHDLTLRALLYDYYELQKYQWLPTEISRQLDDAPVREYIDKIVRKISLGIYSDR